jgi:hypothetical protein
LGPSAIVDGLDPHAPSAAAPLPLDLLHVASTSYLLDEVGCAGVHAITPPPSMMAYTPLIACARRQRKGRAQKPPLLLTGRPHNGLEGCASSLDGAAQPPINGFAGDAPPKPTNSLELGSELLGRGPNKGPRPMLGAFLAPRSMALEGLPQKASSRGLGPATAALRRAWCFR